LLFCGCIVALYLFSECYYYSGWEVVIVGFPVYGLSFYCPVCFHSVVICSNCWCNICMLLF
jgi:hypothetical protein